MTGHPLSKLADRGSARSQARSWLLGLCLFVPLELAASIPLSVYDNQWVVVEVEDLRADPENGLVSNALIFTFHDGSFDLFDYHQPASDRLTGFVNYFGDLNEPVRALFPEDMVFGERSFPFGNFNTQPDLSAIPRDDIPDDETFLAGYYVLEPEETPYFSFFSRVFPGDDLFLGNEDPQRYRLFDENGQFTGPIVIDVYGSDLLDAGIRENGEEDLLYYDTAGIEESSLLRRTEQDVVRPHPGFIGSSRSGGESPGRLLSTEQQFCFPIIPELQSELSCIDYEPGKLDFTEPGYPMFRIRITASNRTLHGGWSGTYFDPDRQGEGFSVEFFGSDPDRVTLFWFTYEDDESGDQQWLIGQGKKVFYLTQSLWRVDEYELTLYTTEGGRLASLDNPGDVELVEWGSARLGVSRSERPDLVPACRRLRLFDIEPLADDVVLDLPAAENGLPEYEMVRIGPLLSGVESLCANATEYPELSAGDD